MLAITMATMLGLGVTSCGDDDDDEAGGGGGNNHAGVLDHDFSKRVKSVGNYTFYYKDNGQVDYITDGNTRYDFSYNPNKIIESYRGEEEAIYTVSYNGLGYITKMEVKETFEEDGLVEITASSTLSYDNRGHLVSIKGSSSQKYQGATRTGSGTVTLKWQNNRLVSAIWITNEQDPEGGNSSYSETYNYTYADNINDYHNLHHQYAPSLEDAYGDEPDDALAFVGLLGTGSLYLPESCTSEWSETGGTRAGDSDYGSSTERFSYGFNEDGSISFCNVNGRSYNYSYEYLSNETRSAKDDSLDKERKHFRILFPICKR